jgi:hypothetical protein
LWRLCSELWRQKNWLLNHNNASSQISIFCQKQHDCHPHPPYSPDLAPCDFSLSLIEDETERPPFWHSWGNRGRIAGCAEHPHRTWLSGCI